MNNRALPSGVVPVRRTPLFTHTSLPPGLAKPHRTSVWAELRVQAGSVRYMDLEGESRRDLQLQAGEVAVIAPNVQHQVALSADAEFFIEFFDEPSAVSEDE